MDSKKSLQTVFSELCAHREKAVVGNNQRLTFHKCIKQNYPHHYVISVNPDDSAEFMGYAEAGLAKATLDSEDDHVERHRKYTAPRGGRVHKQQGAVEDHVYFGKYTYEWQGKEFILYQTSYKDYWDRDNPWNFLLYPRGLSKGLETGAEGNCPEIDALLLELGYWSSVPHKDIYVFDEGYIRRSRSTWESIKDSSWDDVVMDPNTKTQLMKDILGFFTDATRDIYFKYQIPYKRGILLHGVPGNGKTSTIRALIAHLMRQPEPIPTLYVKSTYDKCKGDQHSIKKIFEHARRMAPCCVVLEDLDSLVNDSKVRSYFLNEMDGLDANDGILILGSTNHLDGIDEAIRSRPSRFDRKYAFNIPNRAERVLYGQYWFNKLKGNDDVSFPEEMCPVVADLTEGFSYAFLKELFISALVMIARQAVGEDIDWDVINPSSAEGSVKGDETPKDAKDVTEEETQKEQKEDKEEEKDKESVKCEKCEKCESNSDKEKTEPKKKRDIPKIDIPESLKENTFFKLIYMNVGVLLQNMNDNDEAEAKQKKTKKAKKDSSDNDDEDDSCTDSSCSKNH
jgi:transitional endoplasmic reticulum ATPase